MLAISLHFLITFKILILYFSRIEIDLSITLFVYRFSHVKNVEIRDLNI